jgi:hypothetical protein
VTPIRLLCVALVVTLLAVGAGAFAQRGPDRQPEVEPAPVASHVDAVAVLHAWDGRRSAAWAAGDGRRLAALYLRGSWAGRADRAALRAYAARGLRVEGLAMQLLAVRVLAASEARLALRVTDRLAAGVAVGRGTRIPLPRDEPSERVVVLRRTKGEWLVASVRDYPAR